MPIPPKSLWASLSPPCRRAIVEELAKKLDTITYEVFCNVSARVPRVYLDDGVARLRTRFDS